MKQSSEILLSTTPSLDGYEITEYIDIISAETVYKLSLSKALTSALSNVIDSWKIFSSNELSGTTELIHEAKEYIKSELIKKAQELNADAIVGIDIESSFSSADGFAKVSMNGTAVKISKIDISHFDETLRFTSLKTNVLWPFRLTSIIFSNSSNTVSIAADIFNSKKETISNILADVSIKTIFDEEILLDNIHFYSFSEESGKHLMSKFVEVSLPSDICHKIAACSIVVRKYISEKQLITVTDSELEDLPDDTISEKSEKIISEDSSSKYIDPVKSINDILPIIESMGTAQEIYNYLNDYNNSHEQFISPLLFDQLKESLKIERLYGNCPDSCIKKVKNFYDL